MTDAAAINAIRFAAGLFEHYEIALGQAIDASRSANESEFETRAGSARR